MTQRRRRRRHGRRAGGQRRRNHAGSPVPDPSRSYGRAGSARCRGRRAGDLDRGRGCRLGPDFHGGVCRLFMFSLFQSSATGCKVILSRKYVLDTHRGFSANRGCARRRRLSTTSRVPQRWVQRLRAVGRKEAVLGGLVRADVAHQLASRTRQAPQGMEAVLEDTAATRRDAILLPHARSDHQEETQEDQPGREREPVVEDAYVGSTAVLRVVATRAVVVRCALLADGTQARPEGSRQQARQPKEAGLIATERV